jgi:hypothetical protein
VAATARADAVKMHQKELIGTDARRKCVGSGCLKDVEAEDGVAVVEVEVARCDANSPSGG